MEAKHDTTEIDRYTKEALGLVAEGGAEAVAALYAVAMSHAVFGKYGAAPVHTAAFRLLKELRFFHTPGKDEWEADCDTHRMAARWYRRWCTACYSDRNA